MAYLERALDLHSIMFTAPYAVLESVSVESILNPSKLSAA